jgi:hypothetical protein
MGSEISPELEDVLLEAIERAETAAKVAEDAAKAAQHAADKIKLAKQKMKNYKRQISNIESDNIQKVDMLKEELLDIVKKAAKKNKALKKIAKLNTGKKS